MHDTSGPCFGLGLYLGSSQPNSSIPDNWPNGRNHCSDCLRIIELADCAYLFLFAEVAPSGPSRVAHLIDIDCRDIVSRVGTTDADCWSDLCRTIVSCGASNYLVVAGWRRLTIRSTCRRGMHALGCRGSQQYCGSVLYQQKFYIRVESRAH